MAARSGSNAPAWLFSFVDLAFLLLIAMTQVGSRADALPLGELVVPRLASEATGELPTSAPRRWQLRVHPPAHDGEPAFELLRGDESLRLDTDRLAERLAGLRAVSEPRPILAPHSDSRSEDMLQAAGLLEEHWPERRRAVVSPLLGMR